MPRENRQKKDVKGRRIGSSRPTDELFGTALCSCYALLSFRFAKNVFVLQLSGDAYRKGKEIFLYDMGIITHKGMDFVACFQKIQL